MDELLVYRKRLRRELEDYQRNVPPHVRAARMADDNDKRLGRAFQYQGSSRTRISYVITTSGPQPLEMRHAPIDYHHYIESASCSPWPMPSCRSCRTTSPS
jgi:DNA polymerase-2